jgi:His-Xaa-Ser system radical SAM maturase HxsB
MEYILNTIRKKDFGEELLITTDHGSWAFIKKKDYPFLMQNKLKKGKLYSELHDKGIILTEDNLDNVVKDLRSRYSFLDGGTSLHIIVVTLRCNQRCNYCHSSVVSESAKDLDLDRKTAKKTVDFIFQSPSDWITIEFQGGEPLLNFDVIKYITKYAKKLNKVYNKNLILTVVTNFTRMDKEKLDFLEEEGFIIVTSLDGPKKLHEKYRNKGTYDSVVKWVKNVSDRANKNPLIKTYALVTITKDSLEYPREIIDEYVGLKFTEIHLRQLSKLGYATNEWGMLSYSSEEFIEFWKKSMDYLIELNKKGVLIKERSACVLLKKIFNKEDPNYLDIRSPGGAIIGQLLYHYNGDIYTSDEGRMVKEDIFKLGNVRDNKYEEIVTSPNALSIIAASIIDTTSYDASPWKAWCGIDPVYNYAEQGGIISRIPENSRYKVQNFQFEYIFGKIRNDAKAKEIFLLWISE